METFKLITPVETVYRRDILLADPALVNPNSANPLEMGEFIEYDSSYKGIRSAGLNPCFAIFGERGRTDMQGSRKAPVLYLGAYEADTTIFDATALTLGAALMVTTVTWNTLSKSGIKKHGGGSELILGYVTRLPASNGNKLRFIKTMG